MPDALSIPSGPARPVDAYQEHAPPASLAQHVECFWSRPASGKAAGLPRSHRVMPDGCVDIVLAFDADGSVATAAMAVGTMTRPLVFHDPTSTSYVGVRCRDATDVDWVSVALDAGYCDQSHLIADVKELTGLPPGAWVGARR